MRTKQWEPVMKKAKKNKNTLDILTAEGIFVISVRAFCLRANYDAGNTVVKRLGLGPMENVGAVP